MNKIQIICDHCKQSVRKVGRLTNVRWKGVNLKLCKTCRKKLKIRVR